jgi:hypothetical protein
MKTLTEKDLKSRIQRLSWKRLTAIYLESKSRAVKDLIQKEARHCGYGMRGLVVAHALRRFENPGC